jgi:protein-tyrosine phosphatase
MNWPSATRRRERSLDSFLTFTSATVIRNVVGVSCAHVATLDQPSPHWSLEGCCNFRDLGGYRAAGGTLRSRRLFRSDSLATASATDRAQLSSLGVATVLDLRSAGEVSLAGRYAGAGVVHHNLPLGDPIAEAATVGWRDPEQVAVHYLELLRSSDESIAEAFAILTDPSAYPTVIHCSIGKDRTGILVALLLSAIGVSDDDVVADYALSGMGTARIALRLREACGAETGALGRFLPALLSAEPETMRCFLCKVRDKFGSVPEYLDRLGVASTIAFIRGALVDPRRA